MFALGVWIALLLTHISRQGLCQPGSGDPMRFSKGTCWQSWSSHLMKHRQLRNVTARCDLDFRRAAQQVRQ